MKKFLSILVISLLLSGSVSAEKVTLNCKFESGEETRTGYQAEKLNNRINETIILDIKAKRIIEAPYINSYVADQRNWESGDGNRGGSMQWYDTSINWDYFIKNTRENKFLERVIGEINRVSGQLYTYKVFYIPNSSDLITTEIYYQCSIKEKMF